MFFSNVKKGAGILFIAAILELFSELIAGAVMLVPEDGNWLKISMAISILSLVILIISGFMDIFGLKTAAKDERHFFDPVPIVYAMLIICTLNIIIGFVNFVFAIGAVAGHLVSVLDISVAVFICINLSRVFEKLGKDELAKEGIKVSVLHIIIFTVTKGIEIFVELNRENTAWSLALCIALAAVYYILTCYGHFELIRYLYHTKKSL